MIDSFFPPGMLFPLARRERKKETIVGGHGIQSIGFLFVSLVINRLKHQPATARLET